MERQYVGKVGTGKTTHAIAGEWRYDATNKSECGRTLTGVEHMHSGTPLEITCKACIRIGGKAELERQAQVTVQPAVWETRGPLLETLDTVPECYWGCDAPIVAVWFDYVGNVEGACAHHFPQIETHPFTMLPAQDAPMANWEREVMETGTIAPEPAPIMCQDCLSRPATIFDTDAPMCQSCYDSALPEEEITMTEPAPAPLPTCAECASEGRTECIHLKEEITMENEKATCATCGGRLIRDWAGWTHASAPDRPHRVRPVLTSHSAAQSASEPAPAPLPATTPLMDSVASLNRSWGRVGKSALRHITKGRKSLCGRDMTDSSTMFPEFRVCGRCERIQEKDAKHARKIAYGAMRDAELDRMTFGGAPYSKAEEERDMRDYAKGYDRTTNADIAILTPEGFVEATPEILAEALSGIAEPVRESLEIDVTELIPGDVIVGAEDMGPVKSHRPGAEGGEMVRFMNGGRDLFGAPQKITVRRNPDGTVPTHEDYPNAEAYASGTENANDYVTDASLPMFGPEWLHAFQTSYAYSLELQAQEERENAPQITVECDLSIRVDGIMINLGWHTFTLGAEESILRRVPELYGEEHGEWRRPGAADWASVIVVDSYTEIDA